jgi:hypothetical protein
VLDVGGQPDEVHDLVEAFGRDRGLARHLRVAGRFRSKRPVEAAWTNQPMGSHP